MIYLGAERTILEPFFQYKIGESYEGKHQSEIKIYGTGKVTKVINRFHSYENTINYDTFLEKREAWLNGEDHYHVTSISGNEFDCTSEELGGNQIWIETMQGESKIVFHLSHLDDVLVNVDDIVNEKTLIGHQGNTGLVSSTKDNTDFTYGSFLFFEVQKDSLFLNPRGYAEGTIVTTYPEEEVREVDSNNPKFLFEAQKDDYYYIYLKTGEKLYLEKTML